MIMGYMITHGFAPLGRHCCAKSIFTFAIVAPSCGTASGLEIDVSVPITCVNPKTEQDETWRSNSCFYEIKEFNVHRNEEFENLASLEGRTKQINSDAKRLCVHEDRSIHLSNIKFVSLDTVGNV
jgi:hypothetical protein